MTRFEKYILDARSCYDDKREQEAVYYYLPEMIKILEELPYHIGPKTLNFLVSKAAPGHDWQEKETGSGGGLT